MSGLPTGLRCPWDTPALEPTAPSLPDTLAAKRPRGRRAAPERPEGNAGVGRTWLYHHLTVSGATADGEAFAAATCGPGIVPWRLDYDRIEEDIFHLAAAQPLAMRNLACFKKLVFCFTVGMVIRPALASVFNNL